MFYSETLLAKTGPLARVWLASNLERKLTKQNVLSSNLESNVKDIIGIGQAPMALRLSGHLLLGVVRIYSRKARYLLDDCSEALVKLRMTFTKGNVDLPSNQTHTANPNTLMLPDTITEVDLFAPLPDPDDLLAEPERRGPGRDPTLLDFGASELLPSTSTPSRRETRHLLDDDDLGLDLGFGDEGLRSTPGLQEDPSIEIGRRAETPRRDEPTLLDDGDDLGLQLGLGDITTGRESSIRPAADEPMLGIEEDYQPVDVEAEEGAEVDVERPQRDSSPLSEIGRERERELEQSFRLDQTAAEVDESTMVQVPQRVKRRRVMQPDHETTLHNSQIKRQQEDRSAITKPPSFLPRDPLLLQLMEMQRRGEFVSNIMGDGALRGWAPELRGIASLEVVRQTGERKRKRDSGIADVETASERQESPQIEIPPEDETFQGVDFGVGATTFPSEGFEAAPAGEEEEPVDDGYAGSPGAPFDVTEAPLLHPSQTGPVSLSTKSAVQLLRSHFAPGHPATATEPPSPSQRTRTEALFTDLCPEDRTTSADATKMFFELLVLGTKDAIKVDQDSSQLGGSIRVRGKRGLWGQWAEVQGSQREVQDAEAEAEGLQTAEA